MRKFFLLFTFVVIFLFSITRISYASTIFSDNFDDPNFLNRWSLYYASDSCTNWQVKDGMIGNPINNIGSCTTNLIPNDSSWPILLKNYSFEVDAKFVNGTDHNLIINVNPPTFTGLELHFQSPGDFTINLPEGSIGNISIPGNYPNNATYRIKSILNNKNLQVYINELLVRDITLPNELLPAKIALRAGTGADGNSETWFDNVLVTSLGPDALNVPLIKQTDNPWQSQIYDSADKWNPADPSIYSWGCAMTSAAMIFKFHGINLMPDGTALDPGSLNSWLKNQRDGYVRNGLVNWLSLTRLPKLTKTINSLTYDALEYLRVPGERKDILTQDINNNKPDILEEPNHFVVAKGIDGDTFSINDSYYNRTTLNDYSNTFKSIGTYVEANSDLSYIMIAVDQDVSAVLKDSLGNPLGDQFIQDPLNNDLTGNPSGQPLKIIYLRKPATGKYFLTLSNSNNKKYKADIYLYDINGNPKVYNVFGIIGPKNTKTIEINFNKNNNNNSGLEVTFDSFIQDINQAYALGLVDINHYKKLIGELNGMINEIKVNQGKSDKKELIKQLDEIEKQLINNHTGINNEAYQIFLYDLEYLKSHL